MGHPSKLFNEEYMSLENEIIFICEGIFDSLSLEELGYKSISLGGVVNQNKLIDLLNKKNVFVIAFDNDEAGRSATESLLEKLKSKNQLSIVFEFDEKYKDINEYLIADRMGLKSKVSEFVKNLENEIERLKKFFNLLLQDKEKYLKLVQLIELKIKK